MNEKKPLLKSFLMILMTLFIPVLFVFEAIQSNRYTMLDNEVDVLEVRQNEAIESNKHLITELGFLSSSARIEKIATEELGMHQATSDEIVRVEMKQGD